MISMAGTELVARQVQQQIGTGDTTYCTLATLHIAQLTLATRLTLATPLTVAAQRTVATQLTVATLCNTTELTFEKCYLQSRYLRTCN